MPDCNNSYRDDLLFNFVDDAVRPCADDVASIEVIIEFFALPRVIAQLSQRGHDLLLYVSWQFSILFFGFWPENDVKHKTE